MLATAIANLVVACRRYLAAYLLLITCGAVLPGLIEPAAAQDRRQNASGEFDFYVLSLSWSPSFCEAANERGGPSKSQQIQCGGRPFSFVVHGLWPQYERGFPNYCQQPAPRLDRNIVSSMLDLMPAPGLIFSEWDKHGTCSGLSARSYFETIRKARAVVKIPEQFIELSEPKTIAPADVEDAVLTRVLLYLQDKPAAFRVIDTHAGCGLYDLTSDEATRGGEWRDGIERLLTADLPPDAAALLKPYLDIVRAWNPSAELRS